MDASPSSNNLQDDATRRDARCRRAWASRACVSFFPFPLSLSLFPFVFSFRTKMCPRERKHPCGPMGFASRTRTPSSSEGGTLDGPLCIPGYAEGTVNGALRTPTSLSLSFDGETVWALSKSLVYPVVITLERHNDVDRTSLRDGSLLIRQLFLVEDCLPLSPSQPPAPSYFLQRREQDSSGRPEETGR